MSLWVNDLDVGVGAPRVFRVSISSAGALRRWALKRLGASWGDFQGRQRGFSRPLGRSSNLRHLSDLEENLPIRIQVFGASSFKDTSTIEFVWSLER